VTQRTPDPRADELNRVLTELDAAVAARFDKPQSIRRARHEDGARHRTGLSAVVAAALRWLGRSPAQPR
jgi:hypothetical protein